MEAKDTVISETVILVPDNVWNRNMVDIEKELRAQAEISFKAGIREAVGWIKENNRANPQPYRGVNISREHWQAKLKEWGL